MQVATLEWKSRNQRTTNGSSGQKQVAIQRVRADSAMVSTLQYCSLVATIKTSSKVDGKHKKSPVDIGLFPHATSYCTASAWTYTTYTSPQGRVKMKRTVLYPLGTWSMWTSALLTCNDLLIYHLLHTQAGTRGTASSPENHPFSVSEPFLSFCIINSQCTVQAAPRSHPDQLPSPARTLRGPGIGRDVHNAPVNLKPNHCNSVFKTFLVK